MLLADCIPLFQSERETKASLSTEVIQERKDLVSYIKSISEVFEVRAVAYHDIGTFSANKKNHTTDRNSSNLY